MEITCRVYKPRRARESPLYRLVEQHLEELLRVWPQRLVRTHGPLRPVVERVLRGFLTCGIVSHGFARLWCPTCRTSVLCPFSCRGRSFCQSCEKKRQLLWAEWLQREVLAPVPHRHVVLTMPRLLRGLFRKRRELLIDLYRRENSAVEVRRALDPVKRYVDEAIGIAKTQGLPAQAARRVIPGLCRLAVEAACMEAVRRRRLAKGENYTAVEELLTEASHGLTKLAALTLFDDPERGGDVLASLRKAEPTFPDTFQTLKY